ncbi:NAD(P)H-dependent glycerol-3-phosphate dehydrogenase [Collinsella sp. BM28]|uniref:NAD(P)H-dependent glycerol-3-phosphate dehydrogenase n=1 Tax=Collinsella sp. BM28 TaxID=3378285 RepID=UPI0038911C0A
MSDMHIALIGTGSWGTAMAGLVASNGNSVTMWSYDLDPVTEINERHTNECFLKDFKLPETVTATNSHDEALAGADAAIFAVPSAFLRGVARDCAPFISDALPVLCLAKGIELGSGLLMSDIIASEIGHPERIAALSGPNHAEEICRGALSASTIACESTEIGEFFKELTLSPSFRVYLSSDMVGVELCGAMKNVMAIICGIAAGSGMGDNALALIMTRGLAEISRLVHACGGEAMTCMGLAGMGDLIVTCTSQHSRNRTFGEAFAHGETLKEYQDRRRMVVEGAAAARSVSELARSKGVDVPLTFALEKLLYGGETIESALAALVSRIPNEEFYGLED